MGSCLCSLGEVGSEFIRCQFTHAHTYVRAPLQIVLYQADWERNQPWNYMAAGMADVVLLVANAEVSRRLLRPT